MLISNSAPFPQCCRCFWLSIHSTSRIKGNYLKSKCKWALYSLCSVPTPVLQSHSNTQKMLKSKAKVSHVNISKITSEKVMDKVIITTQCPLPGSLQLLSCHSPPQYLCTLPLFSLAFSHLVILSHLDFQILSLASVSFGKTKPLVLEPPKATHVGPQGDSVHSPPHRFKTYHKISCLITHL